MKYKILYTYVNEVYPSTIQKRSRYGPKNVTANY
jgi:hypothetical protein